MQKIVKEAAELSGRSVLPVIREPIKLNEAIETAKQNEINLLFEIGAEKFEPRVLKNKIGIFIGPEGGWTEREAELMKQNGFVAVSLGKLTMRGETAGIVATFLCVNM